MKRLVTLISLCLLTSQSRAQDYIPLPEANGKWTNALYLGDAGEYYLSGTVKYCTPGLDTLINAQEYFQIETCGMGYKGAMRNDNGKVWFVPVSDTTEYLLYDFTAQAGDLIENVYIEDQASDFYLVDVHVSQTDSIFIYGANRKFLDVQGLGWVEGIGNLQGLFWEPWVNISGYLLELHCMSINDTTIYPEFSLEECDLVMDVQAPGMSIMEPTIYPNPCQNQFSVSNSAGYLPFKPKDIFIINAQGQRIHPPITLSYSQLTVNLDGFPNGLYLVGSSLCNQLIHFQKVIKSNY